MQVEIAFTHEDGKLIKGHGRRAPIRGSLGTWIRYGNSGHYAVAELRGNNPVQPPLAELRDVKLYAIGNDGFHLRGLECVKRDGVECYVLQGWLVNVKAR